jgi:hypothetical protein
MTSNEVKNGQKSLFKEYFGINMEAHDSTGFFKEIFA